MPFCKPEKVKVLHVDASMRSAGMREGERYEICPHSADTDGVWLEAPNGESVYVMWDFCEQTAEHLDQRFACGVCGEEVSMRDAWMCLRCERLLCRTCAGGQCDCGGAS